MTERLDLMSVRALLAKSHGTTLGEELAKHNADIERRISSGNQHPSVSEDESS